MDSRPRDPSWRWRSNRSSPGTPRRRRPTSPPPERRPTMRIGATGHPSLGLAGLLPVVGSNIDAAAAVGEASAGDGRRRHHDGGGRPRPRMDGYPDPRVDRHRSPGHRGLRGSAPRDELGGRSAPASGDRARGCRRRRARRARRLRLPRLRGRDVPSSRSRRPLPGFDAARHDDVRGAAPIPPQRPGARRAPTGRGHPRGGRGSWSSTTVRSSSNR